MSKTFTIETQGKIRALADLLITTLEDMPADEADQIVASVAKELYNNILGIKGKIKSERTFSACLYYRDGGGQTIWNTKVYFDKEPTTPYFKED